MQRCGRLSNVHDRSSKLKDLGFKGYDGKRKDKSQDRKKCLRLPISAKNFHLEYARPIERNKQVI